LTLELGDLKLLLRDQRAVFRSFRTRNREFCLDLSILGALDRRSLFQGSNVIENRFAISIHVKQ